MKNEALSEEVQEVLTLSPEAIPLEAIHSELYSPLNRPVKEKDIAGTTYAPKPNPETTTQNQEATVSPSATSFREAAAEALEHEAPLDAPEQPINNNLDDERVASGADFEVPVAQARQAADAVMGMANNLLEVGGGYFVKIVKHQEFYDFDEIIQVIETQNEKNVKRILLSEDDKTLLRPLIIAVLQNRAKKLTPEQQLIGAILSILIKKFQVVLEIRAENEILTERILSIIREETAGEASENMETESTYEAASVPDQNKEASDQFENKEVVTTHTADAEFMANSVLEVAVDEPEIETL